MEFDEIMEFNGIMEFNRIMECDGIINEKQNPETLSSLCLDVIIKHFQRFMAIYFFTEDNPRKDFEFLQRAYSAELLEKIKYQQHNSELHMIPIEPYAKFLLNPYLKNVYLSCSTIQNLSIILNRLKEIGPTINSLDTSWIWYYKKIKPLEFSDIVLEIVPFLTNIQTLDLSSTDISENVLRSIKNHCPNLKKLNLWYCRNVTDKCIEALCIRDNDEEFLNKNNNSLQCLNINYTEITVIGVACALRNLKNLINLCHEKVFRALYNLHYSGIKNNPNLPFQTYELKELKISNVNDCIGEFIDICASLCPNIKKLIVFAIKSQSQINTLTNFQKLNSVCLDIFSTSINVLPFIEKRGKNLEKLEIIGGCISVNKLLKFCPELQFLLLNRINFLPEECPETFSFQHLKNLAVEGMNFKEIDTLASITQVLLYSPNLETLSFYICDFFPYMFRLLEKIANGMKNLRKVTFFSTKIKTFRLERFLSKIPSLLILSIRFCELVPEEIRELKWLGRKLNIQIEWDPNSFYHYWLGSDQKDENYDYYIENYDSHDELRWRTYLE